MSRPVAVSVNSLWRNLAVDHAELFAAQAHVHVRGALAANCDDLIAEIQTAPVRRVHVGDRGGTWGEHDIPEASALALCLADKLVGAWVDHVAAEPMRRCPAKWANFYATGEHIGWHRDLLGSVQLLLSLRQPPPECGGVLQLKVDGEVRDIPLQPGDCLLFRATEIEHRTTVLRPAPGTARPTRITAVARFFAPSVA